jgi:hypothetical protein
MKKVNSGIVSPLSRGDLKMLIKQFGLQSWMFDEKLFLFQWKGLEYEFYIYDDKIYLEKITILRDIFFANLEQLESSIKKPKHKLPDFLK